MCVRHACDLFTVIVLGDAHAAVIDALTEGGATLAGLAEAGPILLVAAGIWWAYFRGIDDSTLRLGGGGGSVAGHPTAADRRSPGARCAWALRAWWPRWRPLARSGRRRGRYR
jgi:hypothetical protein